MGDFETVKPQMFRLVRGQTLLRTKRYGAPRRVFSLRSCLFSRGCPGLSCTLWCRHRRHLSKLRRLMGTNMTAPRDARGSKHSRTLMSSTQPKSLRFVAIATCEWLGYCLLLCWLRCARGWLHSRRAPLEVAMRVYPPSHIRSQVTERQRRQSRLGGLTYQSPQCAPGTCSKCGPQIRSCELLCSPPDWAMPHASCSDAMRCDSTTTMLFQEHQAANQPAGTATMGRRAT